MKTLTLIQLQFSIKGYCRWLKIYELHLLTFGRLEMPDTGLNEIKPKCANVSKCQELSSK